MAMLICALAPLQRMLTVGWISDDAAWQVAFRTWRPGSGTLVLPPNTYALRIPLLIATDVLLPSSRWTLFATSLLLNTIGLLLIVRVATEAIAEARGVEASALGRSERLIALGACGASFVVSLTMRLSNAGLTTRNFEAGLYLAILLVGYQTVLGRRHLDTWPRRVGIVLSVGVLGNNDPLFIYSIVAPFLVGVAATIAWRSTRQRSIVVPPSAGRLAVCASLGVAVWLGGRRLLEVVGARIEDSHVGLASLDDYPDHTWVVARGHFRTAGGDLLSDPNRWYRPFGAIFVLVAAAVVVATVTMIGARVAGRSGPTLWMTTLPLIWLVVLTALYLVSSAGASTDAFRYVAVGFPAIGLAGAVVIARHGDSWRWPMAAIVSVVLVVAGLQLIDRDASGRDAEVRATARAVDELTEAGYAYGYSGFWTAHIVTYYADQPQPIVAIECSPQGRTVAFEWIADLGHIADVKDHPEASSFIIVDYLDGRALTCPPGVLRELHGAPGRTISVSPNIEIWLYSDNLVLAGT